MGVLRPSTATFVRGRAGECRGGWVGHLRAHVCPRANSTSSSSGGDDISNIGAVSATVGVRVGSGGLGARCASKLSLINPLLAHTGLVFVCSQGFAVPPKGGLVNLVGAFREGADALLSVGLDGGVGSRHSAFEAHVMETCGGLLGADMVSFRVGGAASLTVTSGVV